MHRNPAQAQRSHYNGGFARIPAGSTGIPLATLASIMSVELDRYVWFALFAARNGHADWDRVVDALRHQPDRSGPELVESLCRDCRLQAADRDRIWESVNVFLATSEAKGSGDDSRIVPAAGQGSGVEEVSLPLFEDATFDAAKEDTTAGSGEGEPGDVSPAGPTRYARVRPLARGGLGQVFVARDEELGREVALKEIQPDLAADFECRQRFSVEAEITGALEHPGVVPVYGYGIYPDGRPFYAMRLIRGESMQKAIAALHAPSQERDTNEEDKSLALRKLLTRFVAVCHAVDFAHSRGVLHRDIKPDNVMLGPYGETLLVDWGLAKVIGRSEEAKADPGIETTLRPPSGKDSQPTQMGSAVGTPAYMSPEQAMGWHDTLGPASDVYSLGAMLYAVLTGKPPFTDRSVANVLRNVQLGEFPSPRSVWHDVPPALEAICLKAMDLKPSGRYASAGELAADVENYLADAPIAAWREPWHARLGRWVRRHRTLVSSLAAAASVLMVSLVVGVVLLAVANRREATLRAEATDERDRASHFYMLARGAVDTYFTQVNEDPRMQAAGLQDLRHELMQTAKEFYEKLATQATDDESLAADRAWAMFQLGVLTEEIGTTSAAIAQFEAARDEFARLAEDRDDVSNVRLGEAMAQMNLANLYHVQGRDEAAEGQLDASSTAFQLLAKEFPDDYRFPWRHSQVLNNRAAWQLERGAWAEAAIDLEEAIKIQEQTWKDNGNALVLSSLTKSHHNLAIAHEEMGDVAAATRQAEAMRARATDLVALDASQPYYHQTLAHAQWKCASLRLTQQQFDDAAPLFKLALGELRKLVAAHPLIVAFQGDLAAAASDYGIALWQTGHPGEAEKAFAEAQGVFERLVATDELSLEHQDHFATLLLNYASLKLDRGQLQDAQALAEQADGLRERLAEKQPQSVVHVRSLARIGVLLSQILDAQGETRAAIRRAEDVIEMLDALDEEIHSAADVQRDLAIAHKQIGDVNFFQSDLDEARAAYIQAEMILTTLHSDDPGSLTVALDLGQTALSLGRIAWQNDDGESTIRHMTKAAELGESILEASPTHLAARRLVRQAHYDLAHEYFKLGRLAEAAGGFRRARALGDDAEAVDAAAWEALMLGFAGDAQGAVTIFEEIGGRRELAVDAPDLAYHVAGHASNLSQAVKGNFDIDATLRADASQRLRRVAFALLEALRDAGFFQSEANRDKLKTDVPLNPLRGEAEFESLLESAEPEEVDR